MLFVMISQQSLRKEWSRKGAGQICPLPAINPEHAGRVSWAGRKIAAAKNAARKRMHGLLSLAIERNSDATGVARRFRVFQGSSTSVRTTMRACLNGVAAVGSKRRTLVELARHHLDVGSASPRGLRVWLRVGAEGVPGNGRAISGDRDKQMTARRRLIAAGRRTASWPRLHSPCVGAIEMKASGVRRLSPRGNNMPAMNTFFVMIADTVAGSIEKDCDA